jgi:hypothetical protein
MSLLCILPDVLVISLLLSWTDVRDIGRLDSAICSRSARAYILDLISDSQFVLQRTYDRERNAMWLIRWIMIRQIATTEIQVSCADMNCPGRLSYLRRHGRRIRCVKVVLGLSCTLSKDELFRDLCENCPNVTFASSEVAVSAATQSHIAENWKQLTHLTIVTRDVGEELTAIGARCQSLVELTLSILDGFSIPVAFFQLCSPNLQKITLRDGLDEPDHISCIAARCPLLQELNISDDFFDDELIELGAGCPKLRTLQMTSNPFVTDVGLLAIARNGALVTLEVENCTQLTDAGLQATASQCPLLECVDLDYCSQLTDATLIALGQHCHHLRELFFDGNRNITHVGLGAIAAGCPLLEEISAEGCRTAGLALEAIAGGCPRLRRFCHESSVPPQAVLALAECCPLLEDVNISGSADVGDEEITALVHGCPALRKLNIRSTSVTEFGLRAIREGSVNLRIIIMNACVGVIEVEDGGFFPRSVTVILH